LFAPGASTTALGPHARLLPWPSLVPPTAALEANRTGNVDGWSWFSAGSFH